MELQTFGVSTYRWCLRHEVQRHRGGTRLMRAIETVTPQLESYGIRVEGLAPFYINLTRPSWQEVQLFLDPTPHEVHIQQIFRALIRKTDTVIDVGANLGRHTVLLGALAGFVHAFEANPALWGNLQRTCDGMGRTLALHRCALGDTNGMVALDTPADHSMSTIHQTDGGTIPLRRLHDFVSHADLLKVDVEGAEAGVFRGASRLLDQPGAPVVIFEELHRHVEAQRVLASFEQAAFTFWAIGTDGSFRRYADDRPACLDVLAVPARRYQEVARRLSLRAEG